ncbi:MAG TPA: hypothetical protein VJP76_06620, partial [Candidatus Tumulicola sp.]|nr:hypothetical protein [Candidatus Tumulicola sp.]
MTRPTWPIAAALAASIAGSAGFIAAYATGGNRLYEGLSLAVMAAGLGAAALGWAFWIVPADTVVDAVDTYPSPQCDRDAQSNELAGVGAAL